MDKFKKISEYMREKKKAARENVEKIMIRKFTRSAKMLGEREKMKERRYIPCKRETDSCNTSVLR